MKKRPIFLSLILSPILLSCAGGEGPSSSSSEGEGERKKVAVEETNLALSDFEASLSSYFAKESGGIRFHSKGDSSLFSLSFKSDGSFEGIGSSGSGDGELKGYSLSLYSDSLDLLYQNADSAEDFSLKFGSPSILFDLSSGGEPSLSFRQGASFYFASVLPESGFYLDLSKAAITRALIESLYPSLSLNERSYLDCTEGYGSVSSLFPLTKKASSFASALRLAVQEGLDDGKGSFYTFEGEERTYLSYSYEDVVSFKERALKAIEKLFEEGENKEGAIAAVESIDSLALSFDYCFDYENPYSLDILGSIAFKESEGPSLSSLSLSLSGDFLSNGTGFSLPSDLGDRAVWVPSTLLA